MAYLVSGIRGRSFDRLLDYQGAHHAGSPCGRAACGVGRHRHLPVDWAIDIRFFHRLFASQRYCPMTHEKYVNAMLTLLSGLMLAGIVGGISMYGQFQAMAEEVKATNYKVDLIIAGKIR
jgi:hypothetical protein